MDCKCGARIFFVKSEKSGRPFPVDWYPAKNGVVKVAKSRADGLASARVLTGPYLKVNKDPLYVSHWSHCPLEAARREKKKAVKEDERKRAAAAATAARAAMDKKTSAAPTVDHRQLDLLR